MGAPVGNVNAVRNKPWADALRRAVARRVEANDKPGLNQLAEVLLDKCAEGDLAALKELGDRLDGKPAQAIVGDDDAPPIRQVLTWKHSTS